MILGCLRAREKLKDAKTTETENRHFKLAPVTME